MSRFNPGSGWREATDDEASDGREMVQHFDVRDGWTNWVRDEVQPLPSEPYTVIYTTGAKGYSDWALVRRVSGDWMELAKGTVFTDEQLSRCITGFKAVAQPQREDLTSK